MTEAELFLKRFNCAQAPVYGYGAVKVGAMRFAIKRFTVAGIGNLSVMDGSAMLGLMKMKTVIFTPLQKDAPLFSYDRIVAMGNDTIIVELYNTLLSQQTDAFNSCNEGFNRLKAGYSHLPQHELGQHWYDGLKLPASIAKKGKRTACVKAFDAMYEAYLNNYLDWLAAAPDCDADAKAAADEQYVSGLLQNGGASTDAFVKAIGKEKTAELFRKVLFGTAHKAD